MMHGMMGSHHAILLLCCKQLFMRSQKKTKAKSKKLAEKKTEKLENAEKQDETEHTSMSIEEAEEADATEAEEVAKEVAKDDKEKKKEKKEISLRQYLLFAEDKKDPSKNVAAFFLQTCPVKAREDFSKRWPSFEIYNVIQSAASSKTASWLKDHDSFQSQLF